jgi:hypothetical protein
MNGWARRGEAWGEEMAFCGDAGSNRDVNTCFVFMAKYEQIHARRWLGKFNLTDFDSSLAPHP